MTVEQIKRRFGIIGASPLLDRAIDIAIQVAPTDLTVLISGESGTGKEAMPQIIHQLSSRKHNKYIAVNCGAIPEGTIDSELFGHEKGAFTGASESRKGYFEVAKGGTIFLDEVAELPLQTQVRLLRVLESGEYIRVGSSKVQKTDVRIVAASNVNIPEAIKKNKFREDLYYRLNTVPIHVPPLRDRKEDIHLLFRKFSSDFAAKYKMPGIQLTDDAIEILEKYRWPGNIRQLKNVTEQISVIESEREVNAKTLMQYLPHEDTDYLPAIYEGEDDKGMSEREILYKVLFELKNDVTDLKKLVFDMLHSGNSEELDKTENRAKIINRLYHEAEKDPDQDKPLQLPEAGRPEENEGIQEYEEVQEEEENLSLAAREKELIRKALEKHKGKRKYAAEELGISERTLYRKIKEYELS